MNLQQVRKHKLVESAKAVYLDGVKYYRVVLKGSGCFDDVVACNIAGWLESAEAN